jgi:hypothetical protein
MIRGPYVNGARIVQMRHTVIWIIAFTGTIDGVLSKFTTGIQLRRVTGKPLIHR